MIKAKAKINTLKGIGNINLISGKTKKRLLKKDSKLPFTVKVKKIEAEKVQGGTYGDSQVAKYTGAYFN